MEVHATCEYVRAWQSFERQLCTVSAAADRFHAWRNVTFLHGVEHNVDDMHLRVNLLLHVVVLVVDIDSDSPFAIFLVQLISNFLDENLAVLKFLPVMVADDI